jgi:hypothetical protein
MSNGKFSIDIAAFVAKAGEKGDLVARKVILGIGRSVIMMSPVGNTELWKTKYPPKGYVGGHFRRNWQFGNGSPPEGEVEGIDPSGGATITELTASVSDFAMGDTGYVVNNLPYANRLEYGWSTQAPAGMVRITVDRFQQIVDEAAAEI